MLKIFESAPKFEFKDQTGKNFKFPDDFNGKWLALFFLRHLGCPLCLEKIKELKKSEQKYKDQGVLVFVVVQSTASRVKEFSAKKQINFHLIGDFERRLYDLYQVAKGGLADFLAPSVLAASIRATFKGNFHGAFEGDELQKPAIFIIDPAGVLVFMEYGKNIANTINEKRFFQVLAKLKERKKE